MSAAKERDIRFLPLLKAVRTSGYEDVLQVLRRQSRKRLVEALQPLGNCCWPPTLSRERDNGIVWPSDTQLRELDLAVAELAMFEREKPPTRFWKAYELVSARSPGIRLVSSLNALVNRASQRMKEAQSLVERVKAIPLLQWILNRGNPAYIRRPEWSYLLSPYEDWAEQQSMETKTRRRELARVRKQKQRARKNRSKKQKLKKAR